MTPREEKMVCKLVDALTDWPCDTFDEKPGGRHYAVDYTIAKSRRMRKIIDEATKVFPFLKIDE